MTMRNFAKLGLVAVAALVFAGLGVSDTLELKDGRVLQGKYLGGTQAVLRFEVNGDVQTFPTHDIVALTFTRGSAGRAPESAPPPPAPADNPPAEQVAPPAGAGEPSPSANNGGDFTLPAGQPLLVRMIDSVDSSKNHVGDIFHASLETDLNVNGVLVARKGSDVYGRLASADSGSASTRRRTVSPPGRPRLSTRTTSWSARGSCYVTRKIESGRSERNRRVPSSVYVRGRTEGTN